MNLVIQSYIKIIKKKIETSRKAYLPVDYIGNIPCTT